MIVDELRVRDAASLGAKVVGQLSRGDEVFVTDVRVSASGLTWVYVQGLWLVADPSTAAPDGTGAAFGFIAEGDASGPFLEPFDIECPALPVNVPELAALKPWGGLDCFGNDSLDLTGYDDPDNYGFGGLCNCVATPEWLIHPFAFRILSPSGAEQHPWLFVRLAPGVDQMWPTPPGRALKIIGHFDDSASSKCQFGHPDPSLQPDVPVTYEDETSVVLGCREQFVLTEVSDASES